MRQGIGREDRERSAAMRAGGMTWAEIARVVRQERDVSARAAMRLAHAWTQAQAAAEWNQRWPEDPKTNKNFTYWERWPTARTGRRPSLARLARLARLYECSIDDLLADVDYGTLDTAGLVGNVRVVENSAWASSSTSATMSDVDRREFLVGGATLAAAPSMAAGLLLDAIVPSRIAVSVGRTEIDQILSATSLFQRSDHEHGGGYARSAAVAHLRSAAELLQARCPEALRSDLFSAVAHLADTCGFMTFDSGDHRAARAMFNAALVCTEAAQDWHLQAAVLVNMTRQALWLGHPDEALALTERALTHSHQVTATERAVVWSTRATAHAQKGDAPATAAAVHASDGHFAGSEPTNDPQWMYYYDNAEHASSTGHALYELVNATGAQATDATQRQRDAWTGFPDHETRSKALSGARLAIILMRSGDPDEAAAAGCAALDVSGQVHSRRTSEYLDVLNGVAELHARRPAVAELRHRILQPV